MTAFSGHTRRGLYSPALQSSLRRLDVLVDWERRLRVAGEKRLMRVSSFPHKRLLDALGSPQTLFRAVHVTGSKGKGSVSALIGSSLQRVGYKVGIYGSPHVERVNERIKISNAEIDDDILAEKLNIVLDARERHVPDATWFDVISATGMLAFKASNVDWAVVEVGMGGRHDSTNVLNAPVVVITNVSLEHRDIIGPTLQDIAYEKAGIIHQNSEVIVGIDGTDPISSIFVEEAAKVRAKVPVFVPPTRGSSITSHNVELARRAIRCALPDIEPNKVLTENFAGQILAQLPARMEQFRVVPAKLMRTESVSMQSIQNRKAVFVILDGAHVASSVRMIMRDCSHRSSRPPVVLLALGHDKDAHGICRAILEFKPALVVVTSVGLEVTYMPATALSSVATSVGLHKVVTCADPETALVHAVDAGTEFKTAVVILGSLHLAGKLRRLLVNAAE